MVDCLTCLLSYVKEAGKSIVTEVVCAPIKRNVGYWWFFEDNMQGLRDATRDLERERCDMDRKIEAARLLVESATPEVRNWLDQVAQKLEEATTTLQSGNHLQRGDIILRYSVGKNAKEKVEYIEKLRDQGKSITVSVPPLPPASGPMISHGKTMEFESRMSVEAGIMESLKDEHVGMIAICGPGGVGKTTMVQRIQDWVRQEKLFDEVVFVVVSQQMDKHKVQTEIAEMLDLNLREATLAGRAHKIRTRLLDSKTKLVIFDDVWKSFDLKDIGVPLGNGSERCKIILTSRLKDVCEEMDVDKVFQMEVLDDEESCRLFVAKCGIREDDSELLPIAKAVAAECRGLPIALVPIAKALKNKDIPTWKDSLLQLRRANPMNFPKVLEDVYKPLKLSYDFLGTEIEKSIFLLCCLFPEDCDITTELLTFCSIGLGIFEGIRNIDEGRNRTHRWVESLKRSFLLFDGSRRDTVKMHDVVRDVAIYIGSKDKDGFLKSLEMPSMDSPNLDSSSNCRWMSTVISNVDAELPVGSAFPNLRLLMILGSHRASEKFNDDNIDFKGMEELKVLSFSWRNAVFPPTLELMKKLKTLHLEYASEVRDISVVGELTNLEILCICCCDSIKELPTNIGRLNRLRLLEVMGCRRLKRVAEGVISSLVRLEELKIVGGFKEWGEKVNGSEERNASLLELQCLPNLTCLEIDISDSNLVAQQICLSQPLVRYRILFTASRYTFDDMEYGRSISVNLPGDISVGNWIHQLVRSSQLLELTGDGSNYFNLAENASLRELMFAQCSTVKKIDCRFSVLEELYLNDLKEVESIVDGTIPEGSIFFQKLKRIQVCRLPKLTHLWRSPTQNVSLRNLESIEIKDCPNLCALFSLETARALVQLQRLQISGCGTIERVFWNEIEINIEDEIVDFPQLKNLSIIHCPKLRIKMGKCPNLQDIELDNFNVLHHLASSMCTRTWITQLHRFSLRNCDTVEELFVDEIEDEGNHHMIFTKLNCLELYDLPSLTTTFHRGVESIKFPKLETMEIGNLPRLNSLLPLDSETTHDDCSLHFFCNQKVEFSCLWTLTIRKLQDNTNKIWCRLVPNHFFCKLDRLYIYDVNGIRNLMSSSVAENLVNLSHLFIQHCREMIEVLEDDKEISFTSLFPKLTYISLWHLPSLKSFCNWEHALEFPSVTEVGIFDCPAMETFTLGPLSAPHNIELNIDGEILVAEKDLNGCLRHHFKESKEGREGRK